jgi:aerobic carbon-monoxide dehydrogenase large subunit
MGLFGIGQAVPREEDPRLLMGKGRYADDISPAGLVHAFVVRSTHAHASLRSINADSARAVPGVHVVLTAAELKARRLGAQRPTVSRKKSDGSPAHVTPQPLLADDRVRFVGQPVAFVVAETLAQAKDAAELVEIDYDPLPAVVCVEQAIADGAQSVWDDNSGNEAFFHEVGNAAATDAAFAKADHIVSHRIVINRVTANSMEPRGCVAEYDAIDDQYTIRCTIQSAHGTRAILAGAYFRKPQNHFRVICDNMGGGFGMKGGCYPEYALSLWAAEVTGRPVKWIAERSEGLLSDEQARDSIVDAELALDKDGNFLGLRSLARTAMGAYNTSDRNVNPTIVALGCLANTYKTPAIHARVIGVFTNTMTIAFYRGGGRPEPLYIIERLVDKAARQLGIDPFELRRRNCISPEIMPYRTSLGQTYDCGDFIKNMDECRRLSDYDGVAARRADARRRGKILGIGVANVCEPSAGRAFEHAEVRFDPSGSVTIFAGAMDHGQGHGTTFKQVLSDRLGIDSDLIKYRYGDTDAVDRGIGTFGSRTAVLCGGAVSVAADRLIEKGKGIAAHFLEAAETDLVFEKGHFVVAGTDRKMEIGEVAKKAFLRETLPPYIETGFSEQADYSSATAWPNGTHICEVEIDELTGCVELTRYVAVDDVGTMINPMLVEGQIFGGIAQGAGQALVEDLIYDRETGQLLTGSFNDYCMPRADDFCRFELHENPIPTASNPLGVKGAGETGTCGSLPAVMNAVNNALASIGGPEIEMPATPERTWRAINLAKVPA